MHVAIQIFNSARQNRGQIELFSRDAINDSPVAGARGSLDPRRCLSSGERSEPVSLFFFLAAIGSACSVK
jgi:hypothetical protein